LHSQTFTAEAAVEKLDVYVGESFIYQIQVQGTDKVDEPKLTGLKGFTIEELGGQQNSSQSVTIVNGRMNRTVRKGYVFSFRLTPRNAGALTIPAFPVTGGGKTIHTRPVTIRVRAPSETSEFKLRVSLSEKQAYVGQPVTMTVTWYIGQNVTNFSFNVPVLNDDRFDVVSLDPAGTPSRTNNYLRIALGADQAIAKKGSSDLGGRSYTTLQFQKVLIPKKAGAISLPQATVTCQTRGVRRRQRSLLDDFFSDPMGIGPSDSQTVIAPSNAVSLSVKNLPVSGRPASFTGLVGRYSIAAQAAPTEMNVGDPITLTLRVAGPTYLANVKLPPLEQQTSLARDFRIPQDRAPGSVENRAKVFTQTIRATHSGVTRIPPIQFSYFNPDTDSYETAETKSIPITVKGTKIITARDAEGFDTGGVIQTELETQEGGIAHNHEGFDALATQGVGLGAWLRSPLSAAFVVLPPLVYFSLLAFVLKQRRQTDPVLRKAQQAHRDLTKTLQKLPASTTTGDQQDAALLDALRRYLGDRLALPAGSLTFADVDKELEIRNVTGAVVDEIKAVFERCEAGRYAGGELAGQDLAGTSARMQKVADKLEKELT